MTPRASAADRKLPKWAQDRIALLEANVEHWREKARQVADGDTDTAIGDYSDGDQPLPRGSRIVFSLPYSAYGAPDRPAKIEAHVDGEHVAVRVVGGQRIIVHPEVSNALRLLVERGPSS